jgi:CrcB protein
MAWKEYLWVGVGGVLGAWARYGLSATILARTAEKTAFPWGTFVINVTGSFLLGAFLTLYERYGWSAHWRLLIAVGFLGAYTTFSTFEYESLRLLVDGESGLALRNIVGSVVAGLIGVCAGVACGRLFALK